MSVSCPECEGDVPLSEPLTQNEVIECPECRAELEVLTANPPTLALAPELDEDWGE